MNEATVGQLILNIGAAGALVWVVKLLVDGKLHTHSEVDGLRQDKQDLLAVNTKLSQALDQSNELLERVIGSSSAGH